MKFITLVQLIYDKAFFLIKFNGYIARPFLIQCSVTQGCPTSVILFAVVLNLLIYLLERHLTGFRIGQRTKKNR